MIYTLVVLYTITIWLAFFFILTIKSLSETNARIERLRQDHEQLRRLFFDTVTGDISLDEF